MQLLIGPPRAAYVVAALDLSSPCLRDPHQSIRQPSPHPRPPFFLYFQALFILVVDIPLRGYFMCCASFLSSFSSQLFSRIFYRVTTDAADPWLDRANRWKVRWPLRRKKPKRIQVRSGGWDRAITVMNSRRLVVLYTLIEIEESFFVFSFFPHTYISGFHHSSFSETLTCPPGHLK